VTLVVLNNFQTFNPFPEQNGRNIFYDMNVNTKISKRKRYGEYDAIVVYWRA